MSTCMRVFEHNLSPCGQPADELARVEVPLSTLVNVQMVERPFDDTPTIKRGKVGSGIHPMDRGLYLVMELALCWGCWRQIGDPMFRVKQALAKTRTRNDV